jgi:hypothetical protein
LVRRKEKEMKFDFGSVNWMTVLVAVILAVIIVKIWR